MTRAARFRKSHTKKAFGVGQVLSNIAVLEEGVDALRVDGGETNGTHGTGQGIYCEGLIQGVHDLGESTGTYRGEHCSAPRGPGEKDCRGPVPGSDVQPVALVAAAAELRAVARRARREATRARRSSSVEPARSAESGHTLMPANRL